jgi:myosin I
MQYLAAVSGKGEGVEVVKNIILESNPLLEAFGNAKTLRNNNSSRFGKYFEIKFDSMGTPRGGYITNYLLEQSRVVYQARGERGFHIFYQLLAGAPKAARGALGLTADRSFFYVSQSKCMTIEDVDDRSEFKATRHAMKVIGMRSREQEAIFKLVAAVLHIGNISFREAANESVHVSNVEFAARLLQVDSKSLEHAIAYRHIKTTREEYDSPNNILKATNARDALAKSLYTRLFDWLVRRVNSAMSNAHDMPLCIGVLDIYGFEIFKRNGFEQFCINFVNEKLQQIFIELTLKSEQEEYVRENIEWKPIKFFNNKVVCDLIEGRRPPGIFSLLDDVCKTMHAQSEGADRAFVGKLSLMHSSHAHFSASSNGFIIKHFAGDVRYSADDFPDKNRDTLTRDLLAVIKTSESPLVQVLFPEDVAQDDRKRPTTSGFKIRNQTAELVKALMLSTPHYVRCIKSNDEKKANYVDQQRVLHQCKYLGLLENIKVRRAGFAYRQEFYKFLNRFQLLSSKTWPAEWRGSDKSGCKAILKSVARELKLTKEEVQLGKSKIFIKNPETVYELDKLKRKKIHTLASKIQRVWRKYAATKHLTKLKQAVTSYFAKRNKERRRGSFYRPFEGVYIPYNEDEDMRALVERFGDERVIFADTIQSLDHARITKTLEMHERTFVVTTVAMYFIETTQLTAEERKQQAQHNAEFPKYVLRRRVPLELVSSISVSKYADDFLAIHCKVEDVKQQPSEWVPDKQAPQCALCGLKFSLFKRRHHCRHCGRVICTKCSMKNQAMPDFDFHEAVRVCDECFGKESSEYLHDQIINSAKKTEILAILRDCVSRQLGHNLSITFTDRISYQVKLSMAQSLMNEIVFKRGHNEDDMKARVAAPNRFEIVSPQGLDQTFVEKRRKAMQVRRKEYAARQEQERELRRQRQTQREAERQASRRARIADKKRRKAEEAARRALEEEEKQNAFGRSSRHRARTMPVPAAAAASSQPAVGPCSECDCTDFRPNMFKKHKCNNCFHTH